MDIEKHGNPNPDAPRELSQFAFLIGTWRCDVKEKGQDGAWATLQATWVCRYILDGYVIADEYRQTTPAGELIRYGATYRSYNTDKNTWILKWHDALASTWLDLGPEELGGVRINDTSITFKHHAGPDSLVRCTFLDISNNHFIWRGELLADRGEARDEVMVIEAYRIEGCR